MKKTASIVLIAIIAVSTVIAQNYGDKALASVISKDRGSRASNGSLLTLAVEEHMYRADVYMSNRQFPSAREHWGIVLKSYPASSSVPRALFGMGRSNMWERNYETAITWFERLIKDYPDTFEGQEGLAYKGACHVRLGQNLEAVKAYEQYTVLFPFGKRIESSYLNILDAYREAGEYELANKWVDKTRQRFGSLPTSTNALHARLRMEVYRANWASVIKTANDLLQLDNFRDSMAFEYEVRYLKGFALEKMGNKIAAGYEYSRIPADPSSYFGGLATDRLEELGVDNAARRSAMKFKSRSIAGNFPVRYKGELLRYASLKGIDPRFVLAIMKQESS
ncbi:MAG: tetratricopeptide repeat protein, partial [Acidobacteriota bacterium]|nr:tetratricopeptide repeat protein [Acidobacteriota bacterium]